MMKTIYLIRHAQSESNAGLAIRPNHLIEITEQGHQQAEDLAKWLLAQKLNQPTQVFVSKFIRTQQTAQPYLDYIQQTAIILDDLFEFDYLDFKGIQHLTYPQLRQRSEEFWCKNDIYHQDSEHTDSYAHFVQRVKNVQQKFLDLPHGQYVVFTHGMWLGMLMWQLLKLDEASILEMQNFLKFELAVRPKNCDVFMLNYSAHFPTLTKIRSNLDNVKNLGETKTHCQNFITK